MRFFLILCLLINIPCFANNDHAAEQKALLQNFANQRLNDRDSLSGRITAISMATQCRKNSPIYVQAGTNGIKDLTPINENSLFQIGSITKSFISVVILQLAQENGFSLDSNTIIAKYFPEYPKWGAITLRQLMNMTSGIPANGNKRTDDIFRKFTADQYHNYIRPVTILNLTYQHPLHFQPGTQYEYSNTNYTLLGMLIQRITHHSPEYEVKKRIIDKLNLQYTYFPKDKLTSLPQVKKSEIVHGYAFFSKDYDPYSFMKFGQDITHFSLSYANYAGAIVSTPEDINIYLHALYNPGILLNAAQIKELTTLVSKINGQPLSLKKWTEKMGYGLGIIGYYSDEEDHIIYLYNGETNGFNFVYFYDPQTEMYLTFAVNSISPIINFNNSKLLFTQLNEICRQN